MKYFLQLITFLIIGLISYGFYKNNETFESGDKFIGFGILIFAFVLMPLFIYHRFKNKKLEDYMFKNEEKRENE